MKIKFKTGLRGRIAVLLLALVLLVFLAVVAISWANAVQQQDDLVISLAGRQPTLIEGMTSQALEIGEDQEDRPRHITALQGAADTFERTLWALTNGGQAPYLSGRSVEVKAAQDPQILAQLHRVHHTWDVFHGYVHVLVAENPDRADFSAAVQAMQQLSPQLIQEAEEVTRRYEAAAAQKAARLGWIQATFFASALLLLSGGYLLTQKHLISPLRVLSSGAERIGQGDLNTPIEVTGPREIEAMALSLDTLRAQLKSSRAELTRRAENLELNVAQRTAELEAAFELSQDTVAAVDLENLLSSVTERALALTQSQASMLCLLDPSGEYLAPAAASGQISIRPASRQSDEPRLITPVLNQGNTLSARLTCANCAIMKAYGPGQCTASPLRVGEHTLGALCVCRTGQQGFDQDEMRALGLLSNSAAIAVANVYLLESAQRHAEQAARLAERDQLAADLHDHLAQTLSFVNIKAEHLKALLAADTHSQAEQELERVQAALTSAHTELRATLRNLRRPTAAADEASRAGADQGVGPTAEAQAEQSLVKALRVCIAEVEEAYGLPVELSISQPEELRLPGAVQKQALYIVREALTNAWRHAQAGHVTVHVERVPEQGEVCISVQDDGDGFDPASVQVEGHLGLMIMRSRAERCGGKLEIDSTPGVGTKVVACLPLKANAIPPRRNARLNFSN